MARGKVTTDHDEIRAFVEKRGGHPARVIRTGGGDDPGLLRIDFPGYGGEGTLEPISWDEFFQKFDEKRLALVYQDEPDSRFTKLVSRQNAKVAGASRAAGPRKRPASRTRPAATRATPRRGRSAGGAGKTAGTRSRSRAASSRGAAASGRRSSGRTTHGRAGSGRSTRSRAASPRRSASRED